MQDTEICYMPAVDMAQAIRTRKLSPLEVIDALQRLWEASDGFKSRDFVGRYNNRYNKMTRELDGRGTTLLT